MNKTFLKVTTLVLASASMASAASYVGGSLGSGASLHYQTDITDTSAVRYSLDLAAVNFNFGQLSAGGSVDYLNDISGQDFAGLQPYYGFGLGAGVGIGSVTGVTLYPHVLAGLRYNVAGPLSVFGELNAGVAIGVSNAGTGVGFGSNARIGINYQLP
ncbi:hypothetical protein DKM44_07570 [Deinococcus irradiatisoli]|uniref:Outer membrane protein beta-barrel domain-containing protein n=1 Tax=Deinococcus irradiatisoli TaxID=2202254 RepID=A0A2Z3JDI6_9DEIO|nr:hypothetical protein [Deinococcus irradiatisoli]AWN23102.1 hypothetical protein DKM44_07570 [Deinococcus irradiatisoli]